MKQLSLVSFYGPKEVPFAERIRECQEAVASGLPRTAWTPYSPTQVHATIAGMERLPGRSRACSRNLWLKRGLEVPMDFSALRGVVARHLPLAIRFGGFGAAEQPFLSRGETPYRRSFRIRLRDRRVTLIGWAHRQGGFGERLLAGLRSDLARTCGIEHKYDEDDDLFLVLGTLGGEGDAAHTGPDGGAVAEVERAVRDRLARHPLEVELGTDRVAIVRYEAESLEPASTAVYPLDDARLSPEFLEGLYEDFDVI